MTVHASNMFFLGNFADMDVSEFGYDADTPNAILGSHDQPPLVAVNVDDADGDGDIYDDDLGSAAETLSYDAGSGSQVEYIDSTLVYNVTVTLGDGSTNGFLATAIQMQNGDVFLTDYANNGSLDNLNIQNISLDSLYDDDYSAFFADSSVDNTNVVCFTRQTEILTAKGPVPIPRLRVGDRVMTRDRGFQPVRWVGGRLHPRPGKHAPIHIAPGTLGDNAQSRALCVSPQHRVLASSPIVKRMFDADEVFVAAQSLLGLPGVEQAPGTRPVSYWHFACDQHEVVRANDVWTESLFPGPVTLAALPAGQPDELKALLGDMHDTGQDALARPCPPLRRQKTLILRSLGNAQHTLSP